MKQIVRCSLLVLFFLQASVLFAFQETEMRVGISAEEIFVGESIDYTIEVRNLEKPTRPDMSALKELFEVIETGDQQRNESSMTIINGRISQSVVYGHVYQYRLTPKQSGNLQIPGPSMTIDGKTLTGRKLALRVIKPEPQDLVVAEMKASHTKVYPTQDFTVTLTILVQPLPDNSSADPLRPLRREPPHIELNWIDTPEGLSAGDSAKWLQPLLSRSGWRFHAQ